MKRWLETKGQGLCMWLAVMRVYHGQPWGWLETAWVGVWWRWDIIRAILKAVESAQPASQHPSQNRGQS
jgi:hypothetical protein